MLGAGPSSIRPVTISASTLARASVARAPVNSGESRNGRSLDRTHSPAASPRRILARMSAATRFHGTSGIWFSCGSVSRNRANAPTSAVQRSQPARWRAVFHRAIQPRSPPACNAKTSWLGCFMGLPLPSFHVSPQLGARVGNMRTHRGLRAIQYARDFLRWQAFHIAQQQCLPFARAQQTQSVFQVFAMLAAQQFLFRAFGVALGSLVDFTKRGAGIAP